jgi:hypothetical protein
VHIDSYAFGRITIDGHEYGSDLIILDGTVRAPWWRQAGGHVFAPEDLAEVIGAAPEVVLLGTGYLGMVQVRAETVAALEAAGATVVADRTGRIVDEFNRIAGEGRDVAACLHLTC